jgi:Tfp pilus assembly protein PilZ
MNIPEIEYQKYNISLAKLLNLIINLNEEQQRFLLTEVEKIFLKEKRGHVRNVCSVPVRYINYDHIYSNFIINFSRDGCFIKTQNPLSVGEEILMDIHLDSYNKAIRIKGIVAHANRLGIGIKFKEIITTNGGV